MALLSIVAFFIFVAFLPVFCASQEIRVTTRHFEPYMYQNSEGKFVDGIEYNLCKTIAEKLRMQVTFKQSSNKLEQLNMNGTDIIVGGLFLDFTNVSNAVVISMPYIQDDFTWCIGKAKYLAWLTNLMTSASPVIWFLVVFGSGYLFATVLYLLIPFDTEYEQRNRRDWHYTALIVVATIAGMNQRFHPRAWTVRLVYWTVLIGNVFYIQVAGVFYYNFLKIQHTDHQIATVDEIVSNRFVLMGVPLVQRMVVADKRFTDTQRRSFLSCSNISRCLGHLSEYDSIAIGGSRHHILATSAYQSNDIYCFDRKENIANYRVVMVIDADFNHRYNVNQIIRHIFETGLLNHWHSNVKQMRMKQSMQLGSLSLGFNQVSAICYIWAIGLIVSFLTFVAEHIIQKKLRNPKAKRIWVYLEQWFDGERHYFTHLPERLQQSRTVKRSK